MNYFAALLLAAGLPATGTVAVPVSAPAPVTVATSAPTIQTSIGAPSSGVATVTQAYQTLQQVGATVAPSTTSAAPVPADAATSGSGSATSTAPASAATTSANTPAAMISLINQAREADGLAPYTVNATLMTLAQERAVALANGPFTSDLPVYGWPVQMEEAAGIQAEGMGAENIAEASSVSQAFSLLMASPPHEANILNPDETQIGVGVAPWGSGVAISELFIGPNT